MHSQQQKIARERASIINVPLRHQSPKGFSPVRLAEAPRASAIGLIAAVCRVE